MRQQQAIETRQGVSIHAELEGDGPPIVWVAGLGDDCASWDRARLANASLATVRAGHILFWDRPDEFAALVREFLRRQEPASPI